MKKLLVLLLSLALLLALAACGPAPAPDPAPAEEGAAPLQAAAQQAAGAAPAEADPAAEAHYSDTMVPYDQLPANNRIIVLQNALNYSRDGFYTADTKPVAEEITLNGSPTLAYPISYATQFLTNGLTGTVTVGDAAGATHEIAADAFQAMYVVLDFTSDAAPLLCAADGGNAVDFAYAITEAGEGLYSVTASSTHQCLDILALFGWDTAADYRYMATDQFHIPVPAANNATGEIRGALSGAINGSFPDLSIASGKINDVIYIEVIE